MWTPTLLLKSGLLRFPSPVKIVFKWNIVLSSQCQIFIKKLSAIEVTKRTLNFFFWRFIWFLRYYSLSIINAHWSLAKKLLDRERGLGELSRFSHPLRRCGVDGDWWGWWQLLTCKIFKFSTLFTAEISCLHLKTW